MAKVTITFETEDLQNLLEWISSADSDGWASDGLSYSKSSDGTCLDSMNRAVDGIKNALAATNQE